MPKKRKKTPKRPRDDARKAETRQPGEPKGFPPPPGSTKGYENPAQGLV